MAHHADCCPDNDGRTDECKRGEPCDCLAQIPMHRRTDKIIFSQPIPPTPRIPFGSEKTPCLHDDVQAEMECPPKACGDYGTIEVPLDCSQNARPVKCRITGPEPDRTRPPVRLLPGDQGDWTRFDVTSDIPTEYSILPLQSTSVVRSELSCEGEQGDEPVDEKCRCDKPFCRACKVVESSSESLEEIMVEKSVSFDDEMLDAVDSDNWLNPVAHKKVLQFTSPAARENYKRDLLKRMTRTAVTIPRTEWIQHLHDFDHYVTIVMGESSSSSSDYGDSDVRLERKIHRKQKRKKRLMYSVENMKETPVHNCHYTRQYLSFMDDLKRGAAVPPTHEWPRFMKTFSGYGKEPSEENEPEWMGLLLMAPTECFREISSSSSCESLPHLSDPGSTTTSLSSSECSPAACARDSAELLRRAGVCSTQNEASQSVDIVKAEEPSISEVLVSGSVGKPPSSASVKPAAKVEPVSPVQSNASDVTYSSYLTNQPPPAPSMTDETNRESASKITDSVLTFKATKSNRETGESLAEQASAMMQSFQSSRQARLQASSKKLKAELLSEDDEIVVLQEEQLPTTLGSIAKVHGEGPFENEVQPEFQTRRRNVIVILKGKLHKLSYECYCGDVCKCDPKQLVEKYMDMLIDEVYNAPGFDYEEEEEDVEETREDQESVGRQWEGGLSSEAESKYDDECRQPATRKKSKVEIPSKTDRSRAFLRGLHVDPSPKDKPRLPPGKFDQEDVIDTKAKPEGILAYKEFHAKGELRGANKCKKKVNKQGVHSSREMLAAEPSSDAFDSGKAESHSDDAAATSSKPSPKSSGDSSDSSIVLCNCCKCEKRYEDSGKVYRSCDKTRCTCCNCKEKIVKVARKIYTRKKGSRFIYVVLKKIRRAINQPSKKNRENYLQRIVKELRDEGQSIPRKKWPYYFKELMIAAGLESPSDETSLSDNESNLNVSKPNIRKIRRRRRGEVNPTQLTAAELQRREWLEWKAKTTEEEQPITSYSVPQRAVLKIEDMSRWQNSEAYYEYLGFILAMNEVVKGHSCKEKFPHSPNVEALLALLDRVSGWIDEIPPVQQPQRFGNKAFRTWLEKLIKEGPTILVELLPVKFHGGLGEAQAYLLEGFGNHTRIDYGTGHEMAFIMFLCCLFKIGVFTQEDQLPVVLSVFARYLDVARKLQTVYKMEPAGSRGVWALDDFQFIPFLWGSAQLIGHPHIRPSSFLKNDIVLGFSDHFMFLACIKYINENKIGPFAEHSNQLWNISAVPTWDKVNSGLIKMYKGEVLCKFPVIQHVLFGSILPITPAPPSQTERVYTGLIRDGLQPNQRPKPCMDPPPPPPQPTPKPDLGDTSKTSLDDSLAEKFQNVPDQDEKRKSTAEADKP